MPIRRRRLLLIALTVALLFLIDGALFTFAPLDPARGLDREENGLWLRSDWYFGRRSDSEIQALADRLRQERIRYAYFHVRHVQADGSLRYRHREEARRLTTLLRRANPKLLPIAWIYAGNRGDGGLPRIRLRDPAVRAGMTGEAVWLVKECGFAGVQWDYEVCPNGDPSYPQLLHETRAALTAAGRPEALVGACTAVWTPAPLPGWREAYFTRMAVECDQLAVMAYDTGLYWPRGYRWLVSEQVRRVTAAARRGNPECRVLIGVPTYSRGGFSHSAWSENLPNALAGVREGLMKSGPGRGSFAGVALFADYTTQPGEWAAYRRIWLGRAVP